MSTPLNYIIGISGKKRSGKTTAGDIVRNTLAGELGEKSLAVIPAAFADMLKVIVCSNYSITLEQLELNKETFRPALQFEGEFRRKLYGEDYWIKLLMSRLASVGKPYIAIITDVRYENEAKYIKEKGGVLWRINRTSFNNGIDTHSSEIALDNYKHFDHTIENDGSLEKLQILIKTLTIAWYKTKVKTT